MQIQLTLALAATLFISGSAYAGGKVVANTTEVKAVILSTVLREVGRPHVLEIRGNFAFSGASHDLGEGDIPTTIRLKAKYDGAKTVLLRCYDLITQYRSGNIKGTLAIDFFANEPMKLYENVIGIKHDRKLVLSDENTDHLTQFGCGLE